MTKSKDSSQNAMRRPRLWTIGLGGCAVLATIGWSASQNSAVSAQSSQKSPTVSQKRAPDATAQGYQPSEFPNVMVRSVPQAVEPKDGAKTADGGWIYVKPGAKLTPEDTAALARSRRVPGVGTRITRGRSAAGGRVLYLDPNRMPLAKAQKNTQGQTLLRCDDKTHRHGENVVYHHAARPITTAQKAAGVAAR